MTLSNAEDGWRQGLADYVWYGIEKLQFYENPPADWVASYRAAFKKMAEETNA